MKKKQSTASLLGAVAMVGITYLYTQRKKSSTSTSTDTSTKTTPTSIKLDVPKQPFSNASLINNKLQIQANKIAGIGKAKREIRLSFYDVDDNICCLSYGSVGGGFMRASCEIDGQLYTAKLPAWIESLNEYRDPYDHLTLPYVYDDPMAQREYVRLYCGIVNEILEYNDADFEIIY